MMVNVQTERKFDEICKEMDIKDKKIAELQGMLSKLLGKNEDQFDQVRGVKMRAQRMTTMVKKLSGLIKKYVEENKELKENLKHIQYKNGLGYESLTPRPEPHKIAKKYNIDLAEMDLGKELSGFKKVSTKKIMEILMKGFNFQKKQTMLANLHNKRRKQQTTTSNFARDKSLLSPKKPSKMRRSSSKDIDILRHGMSPEAIKKAVIPARLRKGSSRNERRSMFQESDSESILSLGPNGSERSKAHTRKSMYSSAKFKTNTNFATNPARENELKAMNFVIEQPNSPLNKSMAPELDFEEQDSASLTEMSSVSHASQEEYRILRDIETDMQEINSNLDNLVASEAKIDS